MLNEFGIMYGDEVWDLERGWKGIYRIHSRLYKKIISLPIHAGNEVAGL
jgi:hypothetical protein